ncbi:MAG: endonuclease NucS [Polyangiaceae bacterium]
MRKRYFNTAGPCIPGVHYMLPAEARLTKARQLVEQGMFFLLHAPRQVGKTTLINNLARSLNAEGKYAAMVVSVEHLREVPSMAEGNLSLARTLHNDSRNWFPDAEQIPAPLVDGPPVSAVHDVLAAWAARSPKPVVLFIDEIDCLQESSLLNLLGQLRRGYTSRPNPFLHSLALVGLRDVRDYKIRLRPGSESIGTASRFNICSDSFTLRNFTAEEVAELYAQHTEDTGQAFTKEAIAYAYDQTRGQPWLVNALARQITENDVTDRTVAITEAHLVSARETLIQRNDTHIDSLADKLNEERVRRVIAPIVAGKLLAPDVMNDDLQYVRDLGLVVTDPEIRIANPIYQEVIPRSLTYVMQRTIPAKTSFYVRPDGGLDMPSLLRAFQEFYAENSESWLERYEYREAGPHLILMAFLQRVVNGGGAIHREMAIGSGRVDLLVEWKDERHALELKIRRGERTRAQGIEQLGRYLERLQLSKGYLVLFDQRPEVSWDDKLFDVEVQAPGGQTIHIFGA